MRQKRIYVSGCIIALLLCFWLMPGTSTKADVTTEPKITETPTATPTETPTETPTATPTVTPTPMPTVCTVGETAYASLKDAAESIKTGTKVGTIQLSADITMTDELSVDNANITLDLAGHVITYTGTASSDALKVAETGILHIIDSKIGGKIQSNIDIEATISVDGGTLTVDSGAIYNHGTGSKLNAAIQLTYGTLTLNGGWIEGYYPLYADIEQKEYVDKSKIEIKNGTLQGYYGSIITSDIATTITGGTFISTNPTIVSDAMGTEYKNAGLLIKYSTADAVRMQISGGTYTGNYGGISWLFRSYSTDALAADTKPTGIKDKCIVTNFGIYKKDSEATVTKYTTSKQAMRTTEKAVNIAIKHYKLTFNPTEGTVNKTYTIITYGAPYGALPTPKRTGYKFLGWYTKKTGGTVVNKERIVKVTKSQTIYAHWEAIKTTITLNANGGKVSPSKITVSYDLQYGALPTPKRTGYTFTGWYTKKSGGTKIISATTVTLSVPKTLYAHWTAVRRTVTFNANGGTGLSFKKLKLSYNQAYGTLPTVRRKGYLFAGWYTKKTGGTKITASTKSKWVENGTVYAHWSKVSVSRGTIKSLKLTSRKLNIKWKTVAYAAGYQVQIASNSKFTKNKRTYTVMTLSKKTSKLKKTKYYVRVRAFRYDSTNAKIYGPWSKVKTKMVK